MEKRQEYVKIKHPLFRPPDRNRLLGSLAARETVHLMHLYVIIKTFANHDLCSPALDGTEHTKHVRPQLPQDSALPQTCYLPPWKYDSGVQA